MRSPSHAALLAALLAATPAAFPAMAADAPPADPVVAKVNGQEFRLHDVRDAAATLPPQLRAVPLPMLYPMLVDQLIDRAALTAQARRDKLQDDPKVQAALRMAENEVLQNAVLSREVEPRITEAAIHARYQAQYAGKPGEEEVHARHILVKSEAEAKDAVKKLEGGAKFEDLAKSLSADPGAQSGGDLGWFKRGDMVPAFADAAFALKPGQYTHAPVHSQFGWHVILVEGRRAAPAQSEAQLHDEIRETLIKEAVKAAVAKARGEAKIEQFPPPPELKAAPKPPAPVAK